MNPVIVTPPALYPVTIEEALGQMRYELTDADPVMDATRFIASATRFVEDYSGKALITRAYRGFMDCWPLVEHKPGRAYHVRSRSFDLPAPPLQALSAITVYDDDDVATVVDPATYIVDADAFVGRVVLRKSAEWPTVARAANGIKVEWTAGFGDAPENVPDNYRQAILLMVSHFDQHREAVVGVDNRDSSTPLPLGVEALIGPPRLWTV